jgi:hypothetical protein
MLWLDAVEPIERRQAHRTAVVVEDEQCVSLPITFPVDSHAHTAEAFQPEVACAISEARRSFLSGYGRLAGTVVRYGRASDTANKRTEEH